MTNERQQLDPVEEAMLELNAAQQAQVFQRTRVDVQALLSPAQQTGVRMLRRMALRLLPVAAVLVVAIGVWSWMFSATLSPGAGGRERKLATVTGTTTTDGAGGSFSTCLNGPTRSVLLAGCREHDYDADGDVDLADFSAYQLAFAGMSR